MKANSTDAQFSAVKTPVLNQGEKTPFKSVYTEALASAHHARVGAERAKDNRANGDADNKRRVKFGTARAGGAAMNTKLRSELGL